MRRMRKLWEKIKRSTIKRACSSSCRSPFTLVSVTVMLIVTLGFSKRFTDSTEKLVMENNRIVLEQVNMNLDEYLHNMMSISNVVYYNIIKEVTLDKLRKTLGIK